MKKLFLILTSVGFLAACNSNKKNNNISQSKQEPSEVAVKPSGTVNADSSKTVKAKNPMDSMVANNSNSSQRYNFREGNFKGATGAGTGGSYAGFGYAQGRYKRKVKPKVKRVFDAPYEQEPVVNTTMDTTQINKTPDMTMNGDSTHLNTNSGIINRDSSNLNNGLTNYSETTDSSSVSKGDSTNMNSGW